MYDLFRYRSFFFEYFGGKKEEIHKADLLRKYRRQHGKRDPEDSTYENVYPPLRNVQT